MKNRLQWLKSRLARMEPAEVFQRVSEVGQHLALWTSLHRIRCRDDSPGTAFSLSITLPQFNGHLRQASSAALDRLVASANRWLHHRGTIFSLHDIPLGDEIDWHRDYASGTVGPKRYSGFINHRESAVAGNIKYVWELNRLQHLVLLALAAAGTGNAQYREEIEKQTASWLKQNSFMQGLNWKSPLEAGMRLISWALVSYLMKEMRASSSTFQSLLRESVYQHQYFIKEFHSRHSSANNHLIGEMTGLYVASVFWPHYHESIAWRSFAKQKLIEESMRQVESDGVGKERAIEYQLFVLEFFLLAGALGQASGDPFPVEFWDRLRRMFEFLTAICDPAGNLPMFGDGDSGQVVWLPETFLERAASLVRLGQSLSQPERHHSLPDLRAILLLWGQMPQEVFPSASTYSESHSGRFPKGGYYVLATGGNRQEEMFVVCDAGPLGFGPLYAHGHADALSFWLSYGGQEFLVDPGTFCYCNADWRHYFRSTAAHNTLRIDGQDQSVPTGPFLWGQVARCQAECFEDGEQLASLKGSHDGYCRLAGPVVHRRHFHLYKASRRLVVADHLECNGDHEVEIFFHFSEQCQVEGVGPSSFVASNGGKRLRICLDSRLAVDLYRGSVDPIRGWISRSFDAKQPSPTVVAKARIRGRTQFLTELAGL